MVDYKNAVLFIGRRMNVIIIEKEIQEGKKKIMEECWLECVVPNYVLPVEIDI